MLSIFYFGLLFISSYFLIKSTGLFIGSSSKIARYFSLSGYTITFLLIATSTSLPETVVGITSALDKNPILSFGNAIGSNIALLTLVIAIPILIGTNIGTHQIIKSEDIYHMALFSMLPILLSIDGTLSQIDGIILFAGYIGNAIVVIKRSTGIESLIEKIEHSSINIWKQFSIFAAALLVIIATSQAIVKSAENISSLLGISLGFVGLTLTAVGTSLPELSFAIQVMKKHKPQEVLGDVTGSVVANATLVLGLTATIHPITINKSTMGPSTLIIMALTLLIFLKAAKTKEKLDKIEAVALLCVYLLFILVEYYLQGIS
ncbi:MAG TPA: sodium:calcium antiporter [Patescibacteria group bacterium]|nr:sodium:calcium antiporter [Patescibacteria group bacterium]